MSQTSLKYLPRILENLLKIFSERLTKRYKKLFFPTGQLHFVHNFPISLLSLPLSATRDQIEMYRMEWLVCDFKKQSKIIVYFSLSLTHSMFHLRFSRITKKNFSMNKFITRENHLQTQSLFKIMARMDYKTASIK